MIFQSTKNDLEFNWDFYRSEFFEAGSSNHSWSKNSGVFFQNHFELVFSRVLLELHAGSMQLWISCDQNHRDIFYYLCLTHLQTDLFTRQKTLLIFAICRSDEVEEEKIDQLWIEAFREISKFASINNCSGLTAFTDLDHMVKKAKSLSDKIIKRDFIYFPLEDT